MPITTNEKYRIKRSKQFDSQMKEVSKLKVFESYSTLLMYCALLGYENNKSAPFASEAEPVQLSFFHNPDKNIMDCLALLKEDGKQKILLDQDGEQKYMVFSNYANAGFPILMQKLNIDENTVFDDTKEEEIADRLYTMLLTKDFLIRNENTIPSSK